MEIGVGEHDFGVYLVGFGFGSPTFWGPVPNFGWGRGIRGSKSRIFGLKRPGFRVKFVFYAPKTPKEKESGPKFGENFFRNFHKGTPLWVEFRKIVPAKKPVSKIATEEFFAPLNSPKN